MSMRIVFRLANTIPADEWLEVGQPVWDPDKNRIGMGAGNAQPVWYPSIDRRTNALVLQGGTSMRSENGGERARIGFPVENVMNLIINEKIVFRADLNFVSTYLPLNATAGGRMVGDFVTDGGSFTTLDVRGIRVSSETNKIDLRGPNNGIIGRIDERGVSSKVQTEAYLAAATSQASQAALMRNMFSSGLIAARNYQNGRAFDPRYKNVVGEVGAINIHSHPAYRSMVGIGELSVLGNGYHLQTQHLDYRLMHPADGQAFGQRTINPGPPVPSSILARPTGFAGFDVGTLAGSQLEYMRNVFTTGAESCVFELSYLEMWLQPFDGTLEDIANNTRHLWSNRNFRNVMERAQYYATTGFKHMQEIVPITPGVVLTTDPVTGHPTLAYVNWRVSSVPVGVLGGDDKTMAMNDGSEWQLKALPFNATKAAAGIVDGSNRFALRRHLYQRMQKNPIKARNYPNLNASSKFNDWLSWENRVPWTTIVNSYHTAMFDCADLEELCHYVPGFEGADSAIIPIELDAMGSFWRGTRDRQQFSTENPRGMTYYSNIARQNQSDPSGFSAFMRGFNDLNLFTAVTRHPEVMYGISWMIPLELILRTPRENWNPLAVPFQAGPSGDGSLDSPYSGWSVNGHFFRTPRSAFTGPYRSTVADTRNQAYIETNIGPGLLEASGIRTFTTDGFRTRFPVIPEASQFSALGQDMAWMKTTLKSLLKRAASGTITSNEIDEAF